MKTLRKTTIKLILLISLIIVCGVSFIITSAFYKSTKTGVGTAVLDKGIYIDVSDLGTDTLSKDMTIPVEYYPENDVSQDNRTNFVIAPSSSAAQYIANPTITAQDNSQSFYLRVKLIGEYYVEGSETPTTFSMSTSQKDMISSIFSTDSNYSPIKFNDCFAPDATGEYYYYVGGGYSVATRNNLTTINQGDSIKLFQGFLEQGVTPVSVVYFRDFDNVPYNVSKVKLSLQIEIATSLSWNMPEVELLTEDDVEVSLIGDTYEITAINTTATTYALPGYYNGTKITHIGSAGTPLDTDAVKVYFANTMTHIGGYGFYDPNAETAPDALSLSYIYLGNNVTTIYQNAFTNTSLSGNLILPITVEYIGDHAFTSLSGLSGVFPYIPNCAYYGNACFAVNSNLTGEVIVAGSVAENAFDSSDITSVKFLSTATTIGNLAFYDVNLIKIIIDSEQISSLNSSESQLYSNKPVNFDVFVKEGLTIGNEINNSLYESKSFVSGYRRFGKAQNISWYAVENSELILNSISWNYAGPDGYTVDNQGGFSKYTIDDIGRPLSKVALYGVNTYQLPIPIVSGYTFDGWYTALTDGIKVANADGTWVDNADGYVKNGAWIKQNNPNVVLYPQFTAKEYNMAYNWAAADSVPSGAPNNYTYGTTTTIPEPTRVGYTFIGWTVTVQLNNKMYGTISSTGALEYNSSNPNAVFYELFNINSNLSYTFNSNSTNKYFKTTGEYYGESYTTDQSNWLVLNAYPQGRTEDYATYSFDVDADYVLDASQVGDLTLTARWQKNESFLLQNWLKVVVNAGYSADAINSITFTNTLPSDGASTYAGEAETTPYDKVLLSTLSVGASNKNGTSAYVKADFLDDVTAYVYSSAYYESRYDIYLYSPTTIYAPVDSTGLFSDTVNYTNFLTLCRSIDFNGTYDAFNTKYVENMSSLFFYCQNLTEIELHGFDTSNVTNMCRMFTMCNALTNINIACAINFDTSHVQDMSYMFSNCKKLTTIPNLDVSSVVNISGMFENCLALQELNLLSWNLSNATETSGMFTACSNLRTIKAPNAVNAALPLPSSNWYNSVDFAGAYSSITSDLAGKTLRLGQKVTFDANGGTVDEPTKVYFIDSTYSTFTTATRTGYTFTGWFTASSGGTQFTSDTVVSNATTRTIYAQWTPNKYKITLSSADASTHGTTVAYYFYETTKTVNGVLTYYYADEACTTPLSNGYDISCPTKTGYTFKGYFTEVNGAGTQYVSASGTFINNVYKTVGDKTLYANWQVNTYNVSFLTGDETEKLSIDGTFESNAVGDTLPHMRNVVGAVSQDYAYSGTNSFKLSKATNGENYDERNIHDLFIEIKVTAGKSYKLSGWVYSANTATYKDALHISLNDGDYIWAGFDTSYVYKNGGGWQKFEVTTPILTTDTYIYCFLDVHSSDQPVYFDEISLMASGYNTPSQTVTYDSAYGELPATLSTTKVGYTFGWSKNYFNPYSVTSMDTGVSRNGETFTLDTGSSNTTVGHILFRMYNSNIILGGFYDIIESSTIGINHITFTKTENYTTLLVAQYGNVQSLQFFYDLSTLPAGEYVLSFNLVENSTNKIVVKDIMIEQNSTNTASKYEPIAESLITSSSIVKTAGDHMLFAQFVPKTYTLSFDANGGECDTTSKEVTYSQTISELPIPTRPGYTFIGWGMNFGGSNYVNYGQDYKFTKVLSVHLDAYMNNWADYFNSQMRLISCTESGGWNIEYNISSGVIVFAINKGGSYINATSTTIQWADLSSGWHTFDMIHDGTYTYGYLDGVQIAVSAYNTSAISYNSTNSIFLGAEAGSSGTSPHGNYFTGQIANVIIQNVTTLVPQDTYNTLTMPAQNVTLYAQWKENSSYLLKNWADKLTDEGYTRNTISNITFTSNIPTGTPLKTISVGALDKNGTSAYVAGREDVEDVTAYVFANGSYYDIYLYSPLTIYAPVDSSYLFSNSASPRFSNLSSITFNNFDTSFVTNMSSMFYNCSSLTSLNLLNFNTSNVTDMRSMFYYCSSLTSLNLSSFNTSNVTNMRFMFYNCLNLTSLNLSSFNTSNVIDMDCMFRGCSGLTSLDLTNFDTSSATFMRDMFNDCSSLTSLNVSGFNTSSVTFMDGMFGDCSSLTSLDVSKFNTAKVTSMNSMFAGCSKLTSLNLSNFNTSSVTDMAWMFSSCSKLTSLNLSSFDMSKVSSTTDMLLGMNALKTIKTPKAVNASITLPYNYNYYEVLNITYCEVIDGSLTSTTIVSLYAGATTLSKNWFKALQNYNSSYEKSMIKNIYFINYKPFISLSIPVGADNMFGTIETSYKNNVLAYLKPVGTGYYTDGFDIYFYSPNKIYAPVDSTKLFEGLSALESISFSNFSTSNVINMLSMFSGCSSLVSLNLINFDTKNVTSLETTFANCSALTTINLSSLITENLTTLNSTFMNCSSLTELNLSSFDVSEVTILSNIFMSCTKLAKVILPKIIGSKNLSLAVSIFTAKNKVWYDSITAAGPYSEADSSMAGKTVIRTIS